MPTVVPGHLQFADSLVGQSSAQQTNAYLETMDHLARKALGFASEKLQLPRVYFLPQAHAETLQLLIVRIALELFLGNRQVAAKRHNLQVRHLHGDLEGIAGRFEGLAKDGVRL